MVIDAILPLAVLDGFSYWMHRSPGDSPAALRRFLKCAGVTNRQNPQSSGLDSRRVSLFLERCVRWFYSFGFLPPYFIWRSAKIYYYFLPSFVSPR